MQTLFALLASFSWQELRNHPWRNAAAVVSVMLGVALAFAVHLINASALDEFAQAVRSVGGQPDLELRAATGSAGGIPDTLLGRMARHPDVALASPVLEISAYALGPTPTTDAPVRAPSARPGDAPRVLLRLVGVDALQVAAISPDLLALPGAGADRLDIFAPDTVFLNASASSEVRSLYWFADGAFLGASQPSEALAWRPGRSGELDVSVVDDQGATATRRIRVAIAP